MNVFLSYAAKDGSYASSPGEALDRAGVRVLEPRNLSAGDNWALETGNALANADALVVLLSPDSVASEWVFCSKNSRDLLTLWNIDHRT